MGNGSGVRLRLRRAAGDRSAGLARAPIGRRSISRPIGRAEYRRQHAYYQGIPYLNDYSSAMHSVTQGHGFFPSAASSSPKSGSSGTVAHRSAAAHPAIRFGFRSRRPTERKNPWATRSICSARSSWCTTKDRSVLYVRLGFLVLGSIILAGGAIL